MKRLLNYYGDDQSRQTKHLSYCMIADYNSYRC